MVVAEAYAARTLDDVKAALAGGTLLVYSVARPLSPDYPVERSGVLATFTFSTPAFDGQSAPAFADNPVIASGSGTPGFARAVAADGTTAIADFSAGPGRTEIKFSQVSITANYPIAVTQFKLEEF